MLSKLRQGLQGLVWIFLMSASLLVCSRQGRADDQCFRQAIPTQYTQRFYVASGGSTAPDCGTDAIKPCADLQAGIDLLNRTRSCDNGSCVVLVRQGVYEKDDGFFVNPRLNLLGSCTFGNEQPNYYRSELRGRPAVKAVNISGATEVSGFVIRGLDGASPAQASIAMTVENSPGLVLRNDLIIAGKGADGASGVQPGQAGTGEPGHPPQGDSGGMGGSACGVSSGNEGLGGKGANTNYVYSYLDFLYLPRQGCKPSNPDNRAQSGYSANGVQGGQAQNNGASGCRCYDGGDDAQTGPTGGGGKEGLRGSPGGTPSQNVLGIFSGVAWQPGPTGGTGAPGSVGSGGAGGSAGGYGFGTDPDIGSSDPGDHAGGAGGGGGGGGCGGSGGPGGGMGGASIPLVLLNTAFLKSPSGISLIPSPGGMGGPGAPGGFGGPGGPGVAGADVKTFYSSEGDFCGGRIPGYGGRGGSGGQGGPGAGGAGGNGGPSFALALINSAAPSLNALTPYGSLPGAGGARGPGSQDQSGDTRAADGQPGAAGYSATAFVTFNVSQHRPPKSGGK